MRDQRNRDLLADLQAFFQEHRRFGDLDDGVEDDSSLDELHCGGVINGSVDDRLARQLLVAAANAGARRSVRLDSPAACD